jgi:NADH-quinone oxidoreductase subunit J
VEELVFYLCAAVAVGAALTVVLQRNAIYCALALIACFGSIAVLFFQLGAQFIAVIQVIVYAGAIMVLFIFAVMLIDPESEAFGLNRLKSLTVIAVPGAALLGFILLWALPTLDPKGATQDFSSAGAVEPIARRLFSEYLLPFEVTSILILVAVLGAMVLAKRAD